MGVLFGVLCALFQEVAGRLRVILNSVNTAVQRLHLATLLQAEEEADDEDGDQSAARDVNSRRERARSAIQTCFLSCFDKNEHLSSVLEWLNDTGKCGLPDVRKS